MVSIVGSSTDRDDDLTPIDDMLGNLVPESVNYSNLEYARPVYVVELYQVESAAVSSSWHQFYQQENLIQDVEAKCCNRARFAQLASCEVHIIVQSLNKH